MDFLECKVCNIHYDEEEHRPRNAPCGHELCSVCIRALIMDSTFVCPKCRYKSQVCVPDDLPVSYGLLDVIRAFKTQTISLPKEPEPKTSGATSDELCKIHHKKIEHRCVKCERWACSDCLDTHSTLIGCSTISLSTAMSSLKTEHSENLDNLLTIFEDDSKYLLSKVHVHEVKIQELNDKKNEIIQQLDEHSKEIKKIGSVVEQGKKQKNNLIDYKKDLMAANSPHSLIDRIEILDQLKLSLKNWSVKNIEMDNLNDFSKGLKEGMNIFMEMVVKNQKRLGKLSKQEENLYVHTLRIQEVTDGSFCIPYDRLQKLLPPNPSLIFLELSLGGTVKGKVLVRLNKSLADIRNNMVDIVTGQHGYTLAGIKPILCYGSNSLFANNLPFGAITVPSTNSGTSRAERGEIIAHYGNGYLQHIRIQIAAYDWGRGYKVLGSIEYGMDMIQECYDNDSSDLCITDCGLVLKGQ